MADRIEWFEITVPAGTSQLIPAQYDLSFFQADVVQIDVKVPPGPAGNVGFYLTAGMSQFIPRTNGSFIVPDNDDFHWTVANAINSGQWGLVAYNTDVWPHILQVSFQVNEITPSPVSSFSPLVSV